VSTASVYGSGGGAASSFAGIFGLIPLTSSLVLGRSGSSSLVVGVMTCMRSAAATEF
jgi:hypothetical protein